MCWLAAILILPYTFLLLFVFFRLRGIKPVDFVSEADIFISVVVPCRNESGNISALLGDIAVQEYSPEKFEVIVVDDNSTDDTFDIASGFKGIFNLRVIKNPEKGKKTALREGIICASGELIVMTDGDCRAGSKWLNAIGSFYNAYRPDIIIGPVKPSPEPGFAGRFRELEFLSLQGVTAGSAAAGMSTMCNGANMAVRREAWLQHSANIRYDIASGDDIFMLQSLKKASNSPILWLESEDALVTASSPDSVISFLRQRKRWISKTGYYTDRFTILLAIITFVTIMIQAGSLVGALIIPDLLITFVMVFIIKSIPDFLILENTSRRYGRSPLMRWFIPSQLIYPFYVLAVILLPVSRRKTGFF